MRRFNCSAILFDMDGTLVDSNAVSETTWCCWAADHRVSMERIRAVHHGRQPEATIGIVAPHLDAVNEARRIYELQETLTEGIGPIEGACSFFDSVPRGRCAIVTAATRRVLELRLRLVGLVPPDVCVTSDALTMGKPDPAGYLEAAGRLGFAPTECIVFEDAPAGLLAAHRAQMRSIAILSNYTEAQLRAELGPAVVPAAFLPNLVGISFTNGHVEVPD